MKTARIELGKPCMMMKVMIMALIASMICSFMANIISYSDGKSQANNHCVV